MVKATKEIVIDKALVAVIKKSQRINNLIVDRDVIHRNLL